MALCRSILNSIFLVGLTGTCFCNSITAGGGATTVGSLSNFGSLGSPFATGVYAIVSNVNHSGVVETLYPNTTPIYSVEVEDLENGTVTGVGVYDEGSEITIIAQPELGYIFSGWTGSKGSSNTPVFVTNIDGTISFIADQDFIILATFTEDTRDPDEDGLSNYQELVVL